MEPLSLRTLDELLNHDRQREADGFPRRIRLGRLAKPVPGKGSQVVVVPTTTEPKFYHDDSVTEDGEGSPTGGSGEGKEGDVLGEAPAEPQEGEGTGAGQGEGGEHDLTNEAYDLGRVLTEKFQLPNIKDKGKKRSFNKYTYDLTDRNRGFGQVLDKKATMRRIIETNIQLGLLAPGDPVDPETLVVGPRDQVYRILSPEKAFETQAVVFFLRDYSGSMEGRPSEVVSLQHLLIYAWLMYQYQSNVVTRFILHDTDAKEVPDFYTYYKSGVSGGTRCAPAFELMNKIIETEHLAADYNIYVFYGTDGDDWDSAGQELAAAIDRTLSFANRVGITVAKSAPDSDTVVERTVERSGFLKTRPKLIRLDAFAATDADEPRIIDGIKKLVG